MANLYLKAALLTVAITMVGFFFIFQLDASRASELRSSVDELALQSETERLLFLYTQTLNGSGSELCAYLSKSAQQREDKAFALSQKIQYYEKGNLLNSDYDRIRNQYYLANAGLYLNLLAAKKYCGSAPYTTVVFFYRISPDCPECRAQGGVLDELRKKEPTLRVFAFPLDTDNPVVLAFAERHGITSAPTLIVDDSVVLRGLQNEEEIGAYIGK
jgi:hypothetical protein